MHGDFPSQRDGRKLVIYVYLKKNPCLWILLSNNEGDRLYIHHNVYTHVLVKNTMKYISSITLNHKNWTYMMKLNWNLIILLIEMKTMYHLNRSSCYKPHRKILLNIILVFSSQACGEWGVSRRLFSAWTGIILGHFRNREWLMGVGCGIFVLGVEVLYNYKYTYCRIWTSLKRPQKWVSIKGR